MVDVEEQLRAMNLRLARLEEAVLGLAKQREEAAAAPARPASVVASAADDEDRFFRNTVPQVDASAVRSQIKASASPFFEKSADESELTVTQVMGWTGATLLVLAAAYLIRLVYDAGWLTPPRQLGLAVLGGSGACRRRRGR